MRMSRRVVFFFIYFFVLGILSFCLVDSFSTRFNLSSSMGSTLSLIYTYSLWVNVKCFRACLLDLSDPFISL